jgi:hypothetical protein
MRSEEHNALTKLKKRSTALQGLSSYKGILTMTKAALGVTILNWQKRQKYYPDDTACG